MRLLLDTHTLLWFLREPDKLPPNVQEEIESSGADAFVSIATLWEIAIKARLGKLQLPGDLAPFLTDHLVRNHVTTLSIHLSHTLHVYMLPALHRDPFDRLLVAQSQLEQLPILTADPLIRQYSVQTIW